MFDFRQSAELQKVITAIYSAGGCLTGVCRGVSGFVDSVDDRGNVIVRAKTVTGFSNLEAIIAGVKNLLPFLLEDGLKENGAHYKKNLIPFTHHVEVDGKLITGQNPQPAARPGGRRWLFLLPHINSLARTAGSGDAKHTAVKRCKPRQTWDELG